MNFAHTGVPTDPKDSMGNMIMIFNLHVIDMVYMWEYRLIQKIVWET